MVKTLTILILALVAMAGCTSPAEIAAPESDSTSSEAAGFGYTVNASEGPVTDFVWTATGTVDQPTNIAALQGPVHDFVGESQEFNGTWSIDVELEPGAQQVWVELTALDGIGYAFVVVEVNVLGQATVSIDYGTTSAREPVEGLVWVNMQQFDSASAYEDEGASHPDYANIHDVMVAWEVQHGHAVDYSYSSSFGGFSIDRIDGEGNALDNGEPPWWCYQVNGEGADGGISLQEFQSGDQVHWELGDCGFVPA